MKSTEMEILVYRFASVILQVKENHLQFHQLHSPPSERRGVGRWLLFGGKKC